MVRTSLLSLAVVAIAGSMAGAAAPNPADKAGFRVYSLSIRCQSRTLLGVYGSAGEAFRVAAEHRSKSPAGGVEVSTGSEGKQVPTGRPIVVEVYTRICPRSDWKKQGSFVDEKKAEEAAKARKAKGEQVEVVHDFAPKEVYHVYAGNCSRSWALRGTYLTAGEACSAAMDCRLTQKLRHCAVTRGAKGQGFHALGQPAQYQVHLQGCKFNWSLVATTKDGKEAEKIADARKKDGYVEIVRQFAGQ